MATKAKAPKKRKRGRPREANAGNYERLYVCLPTDRSLWVRQKALKEHRSVSSMLAVLMDEAIAARIEREGRSV